MATETDNPVKTEMAQGPAKPAAPPAKGILVTEKALARIRAAMAKEKVDPAQGGLDVGDGEWPEQPSRDTGEH